MPIEDELGREDGVADGTQSLQWFTDRAQLIRRFLAYIYAEPPVKRILYFPGDGGNGKTQLLNMLYGTFCKVVPEVARGEVSIEHETYERLIRLFRSAPEDRRRRIVTSFLDFDAPPHGEDNPKELFSALFMLRRALGSQGVRFPRFDYAGVLYLLKNNRFQPERIKQLFPSEEIEFITTLVGLFADNPVVKPVLDVIEVVRKAMGVAGKHLSIEERITLYLQGRGVDAATARRLGVLDAGPGKQLYNELPALFAEDLNEMMARADAPARIVLFFDTLETLYSQERHSTGYDLFKADEWLRRLLRKIALERGIVVVLAGRNQLRWPEAPQYRITPEYLDVVPVNLFSGADALDYLSKRGIGDGVLRGAIIHYASAAKGEVHPLLLGMSADVVKLAEGRGERLGARDFREAPVLDSKEQALIHKLLRYTDETEEYAIRALSVCRVFDYGIYEWLGEKLHFKAEMPRFNRLTEYSFVTRIQQGEGRGLYRIHGLLRRLLYEHDDKLVREADEAMEAYYRKRYKAGNQAAIAEAVYHAARLDPERGAEEWKKAYEAASKAEQYELCDALMEVRGEQGTGAEVAPEVAEGR